MAQGSYNQLVLSSWLGIEGQTQRVAKYSLYQSASAFSSNLPRPKLSLYCIDSKAMRYGASFHGKNRERESLINSTLLGCGKREGVPLVEMRAP